MGHGGPRSDNQGAGCIALFGALFLGAALLLLVPFFLLPAWRAVGTLGWTEVPCTVLESRVETVRGDDGDTYRVAVAYEYEVDGRTYRGDRYDFLPGSSSGPCVNNAPKPPPPPPPPPPNCGRLAGRGGGLPRMFHCTRLIPRSFVPVMFRTTLPV